MLTREAGVGLVAACALTAAFAGLWSFESSELPEHPLLKVMPASGTLDGSWTFTAGGLGPLPPGVGSAPADRFTLHLEAADLPILPVGLHYQVFLRGRAGSGIGELVQKGRIHVLDWESSTDERARADPIEVYLGTPGLASGETGTANLFRVSHFLDVSQTAGTLPSTPRDPLNNVPFREDQADAFLVWQRPSGLRVAGDAFVPIHLPFSTGLWLIDRDGAMPARHVASLPTADLRFANFHWSLDVRSPGPVPANARLVVTIDPPGAAAGPGLPVQFSDLR